MKRQSLSLLMVLLAGTPALAGDWLDVRADEVRILQTGPTVKEGETVRFECSWKLGFADDHSYWSAKKTERFPIQLDVDGQVLLTDEGLVAAGTTLEKPDGGFSSGLRGTSKPAAWTAKGVGPHRLFCSVNKPKGISDQYPGNNVAFIDITVVPGPVVQPGNPWPEKAPSALEGTARRPATLRSETPAASEGSSKAPAGAARTRPPTSGAAAAPKALNPQPEVPSRPRALNPQPEVPSKPKAGDDRKAKTSTSKRKRPTPTP